MGGHRAHGRNDGQVQDAPHGGLHTLQSMGCDMESVLDSDLHTHSYLSYCISQSGPRYCRFLALR